MKKDKDNNDEKKKGRSGFVYIIGFIVGASLAIAIAFRILEYIKQFLEIDGVIEILVYAVSGLFMGALISLFAPNIIRWTYRMGSRFEKSLSGYSSKDITAGTIGLILGLITAFLLSQLISLIPPPPLATILAIFAYLLLSVVGVRLGIKYIGEIIIVNKKAGKGAAEAGSAKYKILDASVIIDGRITELVKTGFLEGPFIIPAFVMSQLQSVAENTDLLKRTRGRRGLDIVASLQNEESAEVVLSETDYPDITDIDTKILKLAEQYRAKVVTNDYALGKLAGVMKVTVLNINELANAIKPVALPGEKMDVHIVKPGKEHGQGIGFLEDGTMIVIENGGDDIGSTVTVTVTTSLQTNTGRMIFTRIM
jgi:uncharacterized protein YacL